MPRGAVSGGIMPANECPYCHQKGKLLMKVNEQSIGNLIIPLTELHQERETEDIPYTCSECGSDFIIRFTISKIYVVEPRIVEYIPPSKGEATRRQRLMQQGAEVVEVLQEEGIGTESDQDSTEQGRI